MRSDWASIPRRGSRFVGLLSMIITSVSGSGFRAQVERKTHSPTREQEPGRPSPGATSSEGGPRRLVPARRAQEKAGQPGDSPGEGTSPLTHRKPSPEWRDARLRSPKACSTAAGSRFQRPTARRPRLLSLPRATRIHPRNEALTRTTLVALASMASSVGLRAPPPETISSR